MNNKEIMLKELEILKKQLEIDKRQLEIDKRELELHQKQLEIMKQNGENSQGNAVQFLNKAQQKPNEIPFHRQQKSPEKFDKSQPMAAYNFSEAELAYMEEQRRAALNQSQSQNHNNNGSGNQGFGW